MGSRDWSQVVRLVRQTSAFTHWAIWTTLPSSLIWDKVLLCSLGWSWRSPPTSKCPDYRYAPSCYYAGMFYFLFMLFLTVVVVTCDLDLHFPIDEVGHLFIAYCPCPYLICRSGKSQGFLFFPPWEVVLGLNLSLEVFLSLSYISSPLSIAASWTISEVCCIDCINSSESIHFWFSWSSLLCFPMLFLFMSLSYFFLNIQELSLPSFCK